MKSCHLLICLSFVMVSALGISSSYASPLREGGVSDGGGDSIGAARVSAQEIAAKIPELSQWIFPWLYKHQNELNEKLIILFKTGSIEVRSSSPCFDKRGNPKDGSIYGGQKNQICLSALLLSQKLNQNNYEAEVAALLIHEFSHFLGTTEDEAVTLQKQALADFAVLNLSETKSKFLSLIDGPQGGAVFKVYGPLENWQQDPKAYTTARDLLYWNQQWGELYGELTDSERGILQYLPSKSLAVFPAYNLKIAVMIAFYQANDLNLDPEVRKQFQDNLDSTFADTNSMTARKFILNREGWDPGADYDLVILNKPITWADQAATMNELVKYLKGLEKEVRAGSEFRFKVY